MKLIQSIENKAEMNSGWLTGKFMKAYLEIEKLGLTISVEVYKNNQIVGGAFGVRNKKVFFGEYINGTEKFAPEFALISLAEKRQKEKAVAYYERAAKVYNELSEKEPEVFTHYLATVLHNLGVLHDDKRDFEKATSYYNQALDIRKFLAEKQPEAFNLDVCVTLLNMVTMFQNLLEIKVDISYKSKALAFLKEVEKRLSNYPDERPVVLSMKSDTQYFNKVDEEYLEILDGVSKADVFSEEIKSTIIPSKKLKFQKQVLNILYGLYIKHQKNEQLQTEILNVYIEYSWLALRSNEIAIAEKAIENGFKIDENSLSLKANQAHLYLIKNEVDKASEIYLSLKNSSNEKNESFKKVLETDLIVLKKDGVLISGINVIEEILT